MGTDAEDAEAMRELRRYATELGHLYREAISNGQNGRAALAACHLVGKVGWAIGMAEEHDSARNLVLNLCVALEDSLVGKHEHPIATGRYHREGVSQVGTAMLGIWGIAVSAVLFLEGRGFSKTRACDEVSRLLKMHGAQNCGPRTVGRWRHRAAESMNGTGGGPVGNFAPNGALRLLTAYQFKQGDPVEFVSAILADAIRKASDT